MMAHAVFPRRPQASVNANKTCFRSTACRTPAFYAFSVCCLNYLQHKWRWSGAFAQPYASSNQFDGVAHTFYEAAESVSVAVYGSVSERPFDLSSFFCVLVLSYWIEFLPCHSKSQIKSLQAVQQTSSANAWTRVFLTRRRAYAVSRLDQRDGGSRRCKIQLINVENE